MPEQDKNNQNNEIITPTGIGGLYIINRPQYADSRGFFKEVFRLSDLESVGISFRPIQCSHSFSEPGVIRAIHTENWQKLVYPVTGKLFSAFVDVRPDSPTFGKTEIVIFDNTDLHNKHLAVFIPRGVGNSLCVMGKEAVNYLYLVDEYWDNSKAQGIAWNDPDLAIAWPIQNPIISERDRKNPYLRDLYPDKFRIK